MTDVPVDPPYLISSPEEYLWFGMFMTSVYVLIPTDFTVFSLLWKSVDDMIQRLYGPNIKPKPKPKKPLKKVLGDKIKPRLKKKPLKKRLKGG